MKVKNTGVRLWVRMHQPKPPKIKNYESKAGTLRVIPGAPEARGRRSFSMAVRSFFGRAAKRGG